MNIYPLRGKFLKYKQYIPLIITVPVVSFLMILTLFIASTSVTSVLEMIYHVIPNSEYEDSEDGIKIQYPSNWQVVPGDNSTFVSVLGTTYNRSTYFYPPNSDSFFYFGVENVPEESFSLKEYAEKSINYASQNVTAFNLISLGGIVLPANHYAYELQYELGSEGVKSKFLVVIFENDDELYYLHYEAEDSEYLHFLPTIQKMINSVTK
jgi:hypothetical protein